MTNIDPSVVSSRLHWRYATKQFDPTRKIPTDLWQRLEDCLVATPSSFGLQPWKFLVVDTVATRTELRGLSWGQSQITDASHLVVFLAQRTMTEAHVDRFITATAAARGVPAEALAGYRGMIAGFIGKGWAAKDLQAWNTRQVYIALGQFMTAAAMLGIDTCPMEGIDMAGYDRVLGLDGTPFTTAVACTVGYRADTDKYASAPKVRYPLGEIVLHV